MSESEMQQQAGGRIKGNCPMGCGETLFIGKGGYVTCSVIGCPDPCAADKILHEHETEHIVQIEDERFHVEHPLRERIDGQLLRCDLHRYLSELDGPPRQPGRYRVIATAKGWSFASTNGRTI